MRVLSLFLLWTAAAGAQPRFARLAGVEGPVEIRIHPSQPWRPALRNTPLIEASSVRTGSGARAEIELDDGGVLRLAGDSECELSDYTRLSTGQRITHISLDSGTAYFAGESAWRDALLLALPAARVSIRRPARVRVAPERIAVFEGEVRFSSALVDLDLREGKMLELDPARADKFYLRPEIARLDSDSQGLDKLQPSSGSLPGLYYGARDLDRHGEWLDIAEFGAVWKPAVEAGWAPFRNGRWLWYEGLGYTWIGAEPWGWLPYHYGRWMLQPSQGWIWVPGARRAFHPGDVYWLRGPGVIGWGPLAPGEAWTGGLAALYLKANTTFARPGAREIDPTGFGDPPQEPLAVAAFTESLPAPGIDPSLLAWTRAPERPGEIRLVPAPPPAPPAWERPRPPEPERPPPITHAPAAQPRPVVVAAAPPPPPIVETYYIAPVYTGIVVMNPPEKKPVRPVRKRRGGRPDAGEEKKEDAGEEKKEEENGEEEEVKEPGR